MIKAMCGGILMGSAAICFGWWQQSTFAGIFMLAVLIILAWDKWVITP